MEDGWKTDKSWDYRFRYGLKSMPTRVAPLSYQTLLAQSVSQVDNSDDKTDEYLDNLREVSDEDTIVQSSDGENLCVFLKNGLFRPWMSNKAAPVEQRCVSRF